jgi:hypothetical protein
LQFGGTRRSIEKANRVMHGAAGLGVDGWVGGRQGQHVLELLVNGAGIEVEPVQLHLVRIDSIKQLAKRDAV